MLKAVTKIFLIFFICSCNKFQETSVATVNRETPRVASIPGPERIQTYDVQHIKINVRFDWNEKKVIGEVETRIVPLADNFKEFEVDAIGFSINSVRGENNSDMKYNYDGKKIKIDPDKNHTVNDTLVYTVNYTCQPERGLYFNYPTELNPSLPHQIWTHGQQEDNRYWIPIYDYPNDKTTFELFVTIDDKFRTLSNGYLENSKKLPGSNERLDHWVMDKPNSTYLIMLAAGEFSITEDNYNTIPVQYYTDRNILKSESDYTFRNTPEMIKLFEKKFGYKYPWNKYAQVIVEDFLFGGMENTSASVFGKFILYNKETEKDYSTDRLISHELGHQWFGDLVTCKNWNELWLNESFGEYSTSLWKEHYSGKDEYDYDIYLNGEEALHAEITTGRYPIWAGYGFVEENVYEKGAVILNTFRYILGDTVFFRSINGLLTEFKYRNIVTDDFIKVINETYNLSNKTNEDFKWMFDQWIWKAGYPEFRVAYNYNEKARQLTLNVKQVQPSDTLTPVFKMPMDIRVKNSDGDRIERIDIKNNDDTFYFNLNSKPELVTFDYGNKILDKTSFDKPFEEWKKQFEISEDAIDRIMALKGAAVFLNKDSTSAAGNSDINQSHSDILDLFKSALEIDKYWGVRAEAAKILSGFLTQEKTSSILKEPYDKQTDPRIKRNILLALGNSKRSDDVDFIKGKIKNETDNYIVADGINALGRCLLPNKIYDEVIPFANRVSHRNAVQGAVIAALDSAAGKIADMRIKKTLMDFAFGINIESFLRVKAILALRNFGKDEDVKNLAIKYLDNNFFYVKAAFISLLSSSNDKSVIPVLQRLKEKTNDKSVSSLISSVIKQLEKSN